MSFNSELMLESVHDWYCAWCLVGLLSADWLHCTCYQRNGLERLSLAIWRCLSWTSLKYFLNLCQYFSVHSFILVFSMIFKHNLITGLCDSYWVGKEFSLWVPMWRRPCRRELLLAILSVWARRDFHISADWIPFVWWLSQYTIYILTVQKLHLQPLRDCLYLNRADLI